MWRRLSPRARRKWRLLRRKPVAFVKIYRRNVLLHVRPLPNPPWYGEDGPKPITVARVRRAAAAASRQYLDTWRVSTGTHGAGSREVTEFREDTMTTVRAAAAQAAEAVQGDADGNVTVGGTKVSKPQSMQETLQSVKQLGDTAADLGRSAAPAARSFLADRVDIAKEALQQFVKGYRDGKRDQIVAHLEEKEAEAREAAHLQRDPAAAAATPAPASAGEAEASTGEALTGEPSTGEPSTGEASTGEASTAEVQGGGSGEKPDETGVATGAKRS